MANGFEPSVWRASLPTNRRKFSDGGEWDRFGRALRRLSDTGRTAQRLLGAPLTDVDVGAGLRGAYPGRGGGLRLDFARGLRDGDTAISVIYSADIQ